MSTEIKTQLRADIGSVLDSPILKEMIAEKNIERKAKFDKAKVELAKALEAERQAQFHLGECRRRAEEARAVYGSALVEYAVIACGIPQAEIGLAGGFCDCAALPE